MRLLRPMLAAALLVAVTAACSSPSTSPGIAVAPTTTTPPVAPKTTDAAKAVAVEETSAYAAGDFAGAWDLWSAAGKKAISRADYTRLHTECKPITGPAFTVDAVRFEGASTAVVRVSRMGFNFTYTVIYEGSQWKWQPLPEDMADYALGVDALIAKQKKAGSCF